MKNTKRIYTEIVFCPEQMENKPESAGPWFARNAEGVAERADTIDEMMELVRTMAAGVLTRRQKAIFRLCYQEQHTQDEIAEILGVSQATVNHHLIGKMKQGKVLGGTMQKIRKSIRKAATKGGGTNARRRQVLIALNDMLDQSMSRRDMASCIRGLRREILPIADTQP